MSNGNDNPVTKPPREQYLDFHCGAEWHLALMTKAAALIYPWALRISKKSGRFRVSPRQAAVYFHVGHRSAQRAYEELLEAGLFELLESGKESGDTSVYKPVKHKEWAEKHPGKCATKIELPWTKENDPLGQELHTITDGRVLFKSFQILAYRKLGFDDETIIKLFQVWYPQYRAEQEAKSSGKSWRKSVGFHFLKSLKTMQNDAGPTGAYPSHRIGVYSAA
jgi:hypothetical protein